jgi:SAM-dependent methyltransferase
MHNYANITFKDRNFIKRWLQKRRLLDALLVGTKIMEHSAVKMLDFGAGNGELCRLAAETYDFKKIVCYEPSVTLCKEAQQNLAALKVTCCSHIYEIPPPSFNLIFCLEVFEHLPEQATMEAINHIHAFLVNDGIAIIGVPHELYLPAFLKGLFRKTRRKNSYDTQLKNILACSFGFPPQQRPLSEIDGLPFHFEHLGFDYRKLKIILQQHFLVQQVFFSPIRFLGSVLNSEVYFVVRKRSLFCGEKK